MINQTIAIDPGATGGIAWNDADGIVQAVKMPVGMTAQVDMLRAIVAAMGPRKAAMERVGTYVSGNSGPSAATFARHCGHLEAALYCLTIPQDPPKGVLPNAWMKPQGFGVTQYLPAGYKDLPKQLRDKARAKAKAQNKHAIQEAMARRYPHLKVTLATADALGILTWAMKREGTI